MKFRRMARNVEGQQEHARRAKATNVDRERLKPVGLCVRGRLGTSSGGRDSIHSFMHARDIAGGQPTCVLSMDEKFDGALNRQQCQKSRHGTRSLPCFSSCLSAPCLSALLSPARQESSVNTIFGNRVVEFNSFSRSSGRVLRKTKFPECSNPKIHHGNNVIIASLNFVFFSMTPSRTCSFLPREDQQR